MASPFLMVRRVVVEGELSCDLQFGPGLNIIHAFQTDNNPQSTNKSGKTALVELIQYGLGRRQPSKEKFHLAPIADQLKTLWLEVEANDSPITIERSLQELGARIKVRERAYSQSLDDTPSALYSVDEISDYFLKVLSIPLVTVRTALGDIVPLSLPTLMRAFILHQEDSFGAILDKVIPEQRRADIIGFLTGITPIERFGIEARLAILQTETQGLEQYFQSVQDFLIRRGLLSLLDASMQVKNAEQALAAAIEAQRELQREIRVAESHQANDQRGRLEDLRNELLSIKDDVARLERILWGQEEEEKRLNEVLASLRSDLHKTQRMQVSTAILSTIDFDVCPRCLQAITVEMRQRESYARCSLCNRPLATTSDTAPRSAPHNDDIQSQIDEAVELIHDLQLEKQNTRQELDAARSREDTLSRELDMETQVYVSPAVDRIVGQAHEIAQCEAKLGEAKALLSQAEALEEIRGRLDVLKTEQAGLEDQLREARKPSRARLEALRQIYADILLAVDFPDFRGVSIDSRTFMPSINGTLYTHTGTAYKGLATVCYHLALLQLSLVESTSFPRMLVIDSPAVGDLNDVSHDRLLRYLADLQLNYGAARRLERGTQPDWQIILTTRRLIPELESLVVERISSPNQMLLRERARKVA